MKRKFEEKREITESISRTVCDICGEVVTDNKPFIRVFATDDNRPVDWSDTLEVCTPACLEKNIKGIRCVLDAKMVPSATDNSCNDKYSDEKEVAYKASSKPYPSIIKPLYIGK